MTQHDITGMETLADDTEAACGILAGTSLLTQQVSCAKVQVDPPGRYTIYRPQRTGAAFTLSHSRYCDLFYINIQVSV